MGAGDERARCNGETLRRWAAAPLLAVVANLLAALCFSRSAHAELQSLRTAAALSARPGACPVAGRVGSSLWSRTAAGARSRVATECSSLARIVGTLRSDPKAAAVLAGEVLPAHHSDVAPEVEAPPAGVLSALELVRARLALANREPGLAYQLFEGVARRHPLPEWDPAALRDYAVSAALVGRLEVATSLYRRLVAVASWLAARDRVAVRLEAALAMLRVASAPSAAAEAMEAVDSVRASSAGESNSQVADLTLILVEIATVLTGGSSREAVRRVNLSEERPLRGAARLTEHDWKLVESWRVWRAARDPDVWAWTAEASVPPAYRRLAERLTAEP